VIRSPLVTLACAFVLWPGAPAGQTASTRTVAITYDDLPGIVLRNRLETLTDVNAGLLRVLTEFNVPAIGFVNEGKLDVPGEREARTALLTRWLDAGLALGNHTYSHRGLTNTLLAEYQADVLKGEEVTRPMVEARGGAFEFFRHPMTQTGPTREVRDGFERFLAEHGYRIAPFTIEDADYIFARVYDVALEAGDVEQAARIRHAYLEHQTSKFVFFEQLSIDTFGREIPQILLVHVNRLNADVAAESYQRMTARGYRFVSLEVALNDEAYRTPDGYVGRFGPSWLHRWRVGLGKPNRLPEEGDPPAWVIEAFERIQGGGR
jgi:peptidoglycan/xylan/chitin deacetylase (PgdA/CDA1 family)